MADHYHFIGIGGIGMSSLAKILLEKGERVSGSDQNAGARTRELASLGADIYLGHGLQQNSTDVINVYSSSIPLDNPERMAAKTLLHRSDVLNGLIQEIKSLVVAGTHGKSTTSSLLSWVLEVAGLNPGFSIGAIPKNFCTNGRWGKGPYFVAEGDESDGTLAKYAPFGGIITNIERDHMDYFKTDEVMIDCFKTFASRVQHLVVCGDDPIVSSLNLPGMSYGRKEGCRARLLKAEQRGWQLILSFEIDLKRFDAIELNLIGEHNALNALSVFVLCQMLGVDEGAIREGFCTFLGVGRRVERKGVLCGAEIFDDYAHHPTEAKTTLEALKKAAPERRLIALFQPHRYTRTKECLDQWGLALLAADAVIVTDIYSAGEKPIAGLDMKCVVAALQKDLKVPCIYLSRKRLTSLGEGVLREGDLLVTLGAGDITNFYDELASGAFALGRGR